MAAPATTYGHFQAMYGDACGQDGFSACLPFAEALVRDMCWPNEPEGCAQEDAWRRAVCAAVAADAALGAGHGLDDADGFTIGSFSVSGSGGASGPSATEAAMRGAARRELVGSGLLYMGLGGLR